MTGSEGPPGSTPEPRPRTLPETLQVGGLLSGTSMDGADAILLEVTGTDPFHLEWRVVAFHSEPWSPGMREGIREACRAGDARRLGELHIALGEAFARVFLELLEGAGVPPGGVAVVGSHGQTVWHEPPTGEGRGYSLQLGDPATLAERTGIPVVHDFRSRDLAAGGHGAPLVPWPDRMLLHRPGVGRALQNLGGMGNVTFLPASGALEEVVAFDTGPGVALLDAAAFRASGGAQSFDVDGRRAARGQADLGLLEALLEDPFFHMPPPRTTGREHFGDEFLDGVVARAAPDGEEAWDDLLATLTLLPAESVVRAYADHLPSQGVDEVVLAGGGASNPALVAALSRGLAPLPVRVGTDALGIDPDAREAAAFALLAWAHLRGIPGNVPGATGAAGPRVLGSFTPGGGAA
jgi:anhydro-N-acetylmuramic acid kinase